MIRISPRLCDIEIKRLTDSFIFADDMYDEDINAGVAADVDAGVAAEIDVDVATVEEKWMLLLHPIETRRSAASLPKGARGLARLGVYPLPSN